MEEKVKESEVNQIQQAIQSFAPGGMGSQSQIRILYVLLDLNSSTRIFQKDNGHRMNPQPGTMVDTSIVKNNGNVIFDFFMISN